MIIPRDCIRLRITASFGVAPSPKLWLYCTAAAEALAVIDADITLVLAIGNPDRLGLMTIFAFPSTIAVICTKKLSPATSGYGTVLFVFMVNNRANGK